jgi:3-oxoacyl-[acyl-carrier-protein] synthase III
MSIKIIATGSALPKKALSNTELAELVDTNDEWIRSRTGISSRYVCTDETISDLAASAAEKALAKSGLKVEDIDLILCSTIFRGLYHPIPFLHRRASSWSQVCRF